MTEPPVRVLVVDDSRDAADTTAAVLRLAGCRVAVCYDGPAALAEAERFHPAVCLLDLGMPGMDGDVLGTALIAQAVAGGWPRPHLVAVTGDGGDEGRRRTADAGYLMHLVKPVEATDLVALAEALGTARPRAGPG